MKREAPPNPFSDAVQACNISLVEAAAYLDRSLNTLQSWTAGKRTAPDDIVAKLRDLYADTITTNADDDRHGRPIPSGALAIRRFTRHPDIIVTFETLREAQLRNPQPDPDADGDYDDGLPPPEEGSDR